MFRLQKTQIFKKPSFDVVSIMQKSDTSICFIVNPAADRNRSSKNIAWLRQEASSRWNTFEVVVVGKHESLVELARQKAGNFEVIVACGGDGTVSQVINGIVHTGSTLGVLPIGSGNDFIKSIGLHKKTLAECLELLYLRNTSRIDLIRYEGDAEGWCANTIGMGLDGWANYYAHHYKRFIGLLVYFLGALKAILKFPGTSMELDYSGKKIGGDYLMMTACNGKWEGGSFFVAPEADMKDGVMNLLTIKKLPISLLVSYLVRFRWGPDRSMKGIKTICCNTAAFTASEPVAVHRDGEHLGANIQHLRLKVEQGVLEVITADTY